MWASRFGPLAPDTIAHQLWGRRYQWTGARRIFDTNLKTVIGDMTEMNAAGAAPSAAPF